MVIDDFRRQSLGLWKPSRANTTVGRIDRKPAPPSPLQLIEFSSRKDSSKTQAQTRVLALLLKASRCTAFRKSSRASEPGKTQKISGKL